MATLEVLTWNMQGGGSWFGAKSFIADYDVVCLQECGTPPDWGTLTKLTNDVQWGDFTQKFKSGSDKITFHAAYYAWQTTKVNKKADNLRCSLAILSKIDFTTTMRIDPPTNLDTRRPLIGIKLTSGLWVYCVHAPSGNKKNARDYTNYMIGQVGGNPQWFIGGDFNCDPTYIKLGLPMATPAWVSNSGKATQQSSGELDYIIHHSTASAQLTVLSGKSSDHFPVGGTLTL